MPRKRSIPSYRYHAAGQAVVTFDQKNFYLGPHDSPQSVAKYHALVAEYVDGGMKAAPPRRPRLTKAPHRSRYVV